MNVAALHDHAQAMLDTIAPRDRFSPTFRAGHRRAPRSVSPVCARGETREKPQTTRICTIL